MSNFLLRDGLHCSFYLVRVCFEWRRCADDMELDVRALRAMTAFAATRHDVVLLTMPLAYVMQRLHRHSVISLHDSQRDEKGRPIALEKWFRVLDRAWTRHDLDRFLPRTRLDENRTPSRHMRLQNPFAICAREWSDVTPSV